MPLLDVGIALEVELIDDAASPGGILVALIHGHEGLQLPLTRLRSQETTQHPILKGLNNIKGGFAKFLEDVTRYHMKS